MLQLGLGLGAYVAKFTESGAFLNPFLVILATSHVVVGALMLVTCVRLTLRAYRLLNPLHPVVRSLDAAEQLPAVQTPSR